MATMHLHNVSSRRGAPMGRAPSEVSAEEVGNLGKFELQQVRIDRGGYDAGGAYWGLGATLYRARAFVDYTGRIGHGEMAEMFFRASSREHAKEIVTAKYPGARFFR